MAIKKFTEGKFEVEAVEVGGLIDYTLNITVTPGDTSKIGTPWESVVELGKGWSVDINCHYNPDDPVQGALITAYTSGNVAFSSISCFEDASVMHYGSALLTSAVITKSVGGVDKFAASFKGDGALSHG